MGLYDDDKAGIKAGDILDVIYWQTKFEFLKLEAALKSRQPEGAVRQIVPGVMSGCTDVLKAYPNHGDVKKWQAKAAEIQSRIDPNAPPGDFKSDFAQWKDHSYEMSWRFYHLAGMAAADGDWALAETYASDADTHLRRATDRMTNWPEDVREWIKSVQQEMQRLREEAAGKK